MKTLRAPIAALIVLALSTFARAQQAASPQAENSLATARRDVARFVGEGEPFTLERQIEYIALVIAKGQKAQMVQQFEAERSDEQIGATSSASGTTTLVSKGTLPEILAFAVENGAVTRSQSGTTMTFRTNLGGAVRALAGQGFIRLDPADDPALAVLGRIGLSASFDTSRGVEPGSPATFTGDQQQLSQWTARAQIVNQRDPNGRGFIEKVWRPKVQPMLNDVAMVTGTLYDALSADAAVQTWIADVEAKLDGARTATAGKTAEERTAAMEDVLKKSESTLAAKALQPGETKAVDVYATAVGRFLGMRRDVLNGLAAGALVALEYTQDRPVHAPRTSNVRLVAEVGGTVDLTANASLTLFNEIPTGVSGRVRDVQAGAEMDMKIGSAETLGPFILSVAGKYLRQFENSFNDAGVMIPDTKGTTAIAQFKLTIPAGKDTGAKIPLSLTFANRTDLIKESVVRANVGVTYDLDALFAKFKP